MSEELRNSLVIAADLGGTHLRVAAVDAAGRIPVRLKERTPKAEQPDEIARMMVAAARACIHQVEDAGGRVRALSVVVPGTVRAEEGIVSKAPNVPALDGFRLAAALGGELRLPVILENDANAAAVGEMWQGAGRGHKSVVCMTLGTGVGGGIIIDGKLLRGIDGSAGEIGHMSIEPFGAPCGCGSRGCLEVYASATAIARMAREALPQYPHSTLPASGRLTAKDIYESGMAGDELALEVFRRMGMYLGIGMANLVNILNPEVIVVGGGVADGWNLFINHAREQMLARAFPEPGRRVTVARAEQGDDAGLLGAAHLAFSSPREAGAAS